MSDNHLFHLKGKIDTERVEFHLERLQSYTERFVCIILLR